MSEDAATGAGPAQRRQVPAILARARVVAPGLALSLIVALAATYVSQTQGAPVMLLALLMGMVMHPVADNDTCVPGIRIAASWVLKFGVALLGLRITAGQIAALGGMAALYVVLGLLVTLATGFALARMLRLRTGFGIISGGATAICGASAALAISSVLPDYEGKEADTVFTVALVTTLSTLAMVFYPGLSVLLELTDHQSGFLFGATIHDVAQVVGAGYAVSPEAGDTATIVKLFRVVLLVPVVLVLGWAAGRNGGRTRTLPLPPFAAAFACLVVVNSLVSLPSALVLPFEELSRWCLVAAVSALGMRTSLSGLARLGPKPLISVTLTTVVLLAFTLSGLALGLL